MEPPKHHRKKEDYRLRTHLIHGNYDSKKWDYDHHVVPPVSQSTAYRLTTLERGAKGFVQFASEEEAMSGHIPIYIYDRLDEPTRGILEENLAYAEGGGYLRHVCHRHGGNQRGAGHDLATGAGGTRQRDPLWLYLQSDDQLATAIRHRRSLC